MELTQVESDCRVRLSRLVELEIADPVRIRNMLSGKERRVNAPIVFTLHRLSEFNSTESVCSMLVAAGLPNSAATRVVRLLIDDATLLVEDSTEADIESVLCDNVGWHRITRNQMLSRRHIQFLDRLDEAQRFQELTSTDPPNFQRALKPQNEGSRHQLPRSDTAYTRMSGGRRSGRLFDVERSLNIETVAAVMAASLMVTGWRRSPFGVSFPRRMTPSCGALSSVGAMILARRVDDLPSGWYQYDAIDHALCATDLPAEVPWEKLTYGQRPFISSAAVIALYHRPSLFGWKYQDSSAYDAVYTEAGTVIQAMAVQCAEFGVAVTPTNALRAPILDSIFPVEKYDEVMPLFLVAAGYPDPYDDADYSPEILDVMLRE